MSTPKHTQAFLKKRQLMVFAPLPIVACMTALFAVGGGGKGVAAATATSNAPGASGLNLSLPSAGKTTLFENKMQAAAAPQDSNRHNNLAFAPPITTAAGAAPGASAAGTQLAGANYAVQPGQSGQKYDPNADPNVVAMQTRMQRLQEQTSTQPGVAPAAAPAASSPRTSSAAVAAAPAHDTRMDASLKELDELKNQYQQRLLAMNSPATSPAAAPVPTSATTAKKMTVITQVRPSVVSTLQQAAPQTNGFHTLGESNTASTVNAVPAVIHNDQVVEAGSTVKLRLLQDVQLEGRLIPRNSFLYGTCSMAGNRLTIAATSVQYQGNLLPVSLKAFDIDGNEGLNIPGSIDRDALKQGAAQGVSSADLLTMSPSLGAQAAGIAIQTGKALTGRKIKTVKIHLKANYQLLLKS
ncbi:conjugative transposon protein TraM [Hymenobacter sp. HMF4947]|uniref:Conjugative transposon protein TraM n=1 Tax=Hymenobacter ginkgonis TaxID=2682976 RepID=A0A7K1TLV4_9BACT|nr:conjugative transposon protein TraM [Hymenobacter ginkgonis]MVN79101.1 conjugative transposon protein TraM [Hymenobacter ginkgonis]